MRRGLTDPPWSRSCRHARSRLFRPIRPRPWSSSPRRSLDMGDRQPARSAFEPRGRPSPTPRPPRQIPISSATSPAPRRPAVSSPGGFRTPALSRVPAVVSGPASETLHKTGHLIAAGEQTVRIGTLRWNRCGALCRFAGCAIRRRLLTGKHPSTFSCNQQWSIV